MVDCLGVLLVWDAVNFGFDVSFDNLQDCKEMREKAGGGNSAKDYKEKSIRCPVEFSTGVTKPGTVPSKAVEEN